ncbi:hypothetical protein [Malikia granosa]|uniref:hypothetical protein n=1 Tax=Malikia granosa TaxID=263067 RepID=UPI001FE5A5A8|nr:hypothetical protein [Malikia granosa]
MTPDSSSRFTRRRQGDGAALSGDLVDLMPGSQDCLIAIFMRADTPTETDLQSLTQLDKLVMSG